MGCAIIKSMYILAYSETGEKEMVLVTGIVVWLAGILIATIVITGMGMEDEFDGEWVMYIFVVLWPLTGLIGAGAWISCKAMKAGQRIGRGLRAKIKSE